MKLQIQMLICEL